MTLYVLAARRDPRGPVSPRPGMRFGAPRNGCLRGDANRHAGRSWRPAATHVARSLRDRECGLERQETVVCAGMQTGTPVDPGGPPGPTWPGLSETGNAVWNAKKRLPARGCRRARRYVLAARRDVKRS